MTASEYSVWRRTVDFYPKRSDEYSILYYTLGLVGEAGEAAEKIKKRSRDGKRDQNGELLEHPDDFKQGLVKELGDVLWYLTAVADQIGCDLQDVIDANYLKLTDRMRRGTNRGEGDNR